MVDRARGEIERERDAAIQALRKESVDLALAAADLTVCRAGASSVVEAAATGLPAVFVPLPIGNGEQHRNARPIVEAGGALLQPTGEGEIVALDPASGTVVRRTPLGAPVVAPLACAGDHVVVVGVDGWARSVPVTHLV